MKATCPYCRNQWFLTPEALALALNNTPAKGRSINVECPRCRRLVKLARPRNMPPTGCCRGRTVGTRRRDGLTSMVFQARRENEKNTPGQSCEPGVY